MTENERKDETGWNFDNSYARLPESLYSSLPPTPVRAPKLTILNERLAASLGLSSEALRSDDGVAVLAGNRVPEGAEPLAQAYAGHQFGYFTMLGDGRALLLGEQITPQGERVDIQLKGSGRTPYSRGGDGRAALGPMLREYIISEAMFALGIPTTRSLAVVSTGQAVVRETDLPGAVLTRVAASHLRVGTFQYAARFGTIEDLRALADYTLQRHYPDALTENNRYLVLLREVIGRQASLIAKWMLVGFVHGVMNTDNMALSGETIDYGPCAFMDAYDPATVFSSIDRQGRYAYGNQPSIAAWNLARFSETLLPLLHDDQEQAIKQAEAEIANFFVLYQRQWLAGMRAKLGLTGEEPEDESLIEELLGLMQKYGADYTNTFRALTLDRTEASDLFDSEEFARWQERWQARLGGGPEAKDAARQLMNRSNPAVIPRNHRVEEALAAAVDDGDLTVMERLLAALSNPYAYSPDQDEYCTLSQSSRPYRTFCGT
ncbi:YdiU family protein [Cohnella sp. CFH 77786]|uniref:protein adenylyltransferase SelO n=1 Tax=Cohnella sp. CFH 77786 TaxID=2662265 RepID=UPI001C6105C9|nr:YdiU family protein [Cohnella sp. CFH 77786]MBW5446087.1 YdiU family protein [Cohnella sp. CFH 77786]